MRDNVIAAKLCVARFNSSLLPYAAQIMAESEVKAICKELFCAGAVGSLVTVSVDRTTQCVVTPVKDRGQFWCMLVFLLQVRMKESGLLSQATLCLSAAMVVWMSDAFAFAKKHSICTEVSYPYRETSGTCSSSSCTVGVSLLLACRLSGCGHTASKL